MEQYVNVQMGEASESITVSWTVDKPKWKTYQNFVTPCCAERKDTKTDTKTCTQ